MVIIFLKIKNQIKNKAIRLEENSNSFIGLRHSQLFFLSYSEITVHEANHFFKSLHCICYNIISTLTIFGLLVTRHVGS